MSETPSTKVPRRRPGFPWFGPTQIWLLVSLLVVLIGSMLRWWNTVAGPVYGLDNWGMISLWAAAVGLAGVFSTRHTLYRFLPALGGAVALGLVIWLMVTGTSECTLDEGTLCQPAFGLIITGAGALNTVFLGGRELLSTRQ
ncbi:MAG: hypothetical protein P1T08_13395 [Acidimicrobiia bacterium]|nr:hypothetical protein [Acidimicrobiia bacterium]